MDVMNEIENENINNMNNDLLLIDSLNEDINVFKKSSKKGRNSRASIMVYQGNRNSLPVTTGAVDTVTTIDEVIEDTAAKIDEIKVTTTIIDTNEENNEEKITEFEETATFESVVEASASVKSDILSSVEEELIHQLNNINIDDDIKEKVATPQPSSSKKAKKTPKSSSKKIKNNEILSPNKNKNMLTTTSLVLPAKEKLIDNNITTKSMTLKSLATPQKETISKKKSLKNKKSTKSLTIPVTPKFKLDKRIGKKEIIVEKVESKTTLVDYGPKQAMATSEVPKGPTIPQPFCFATDKRTTSVPTVDAAPSAAELAEKFMRDARSHNVPDNVCKQLTDPKTPNFKTGKRLDKGEKKEVNTVPSAAELAEKFMKDARSHNVPLNVCKQLTIGSAPTLKADMRCKSQHKTKPLSHEEQEAKIVEDYNKIGFKAKPVDKRIFQSQGEIGVPKVAARPVTQPKEFSFNTDKRLGAPIKPVDTDATFKSLKASATAATVSKGPTVPVSPKLSVARGQRASSAPARRQKEKFVKPKEVTKYTSPPKLTKPTPFHLHTQDRGVMHRASLEEQVLRQKLAEEQQREIHVTPAPKFEQPFQPKHIEKKTEIEEFHLKSVVRHEQATAQFETAIMMEEANKPTFHARPVPPSLINPTFKIEKDINHVPIVPKETHLESELRAAKRKEFDDTVANQKKLLHKKKMEDEKLKHDKENEDLNILRRKSVAEGGFMFVAKPIMTKDLYPSKAQKQIPLTTPFSPQFKSKFNK